MTVFVLIEIFAMCFILSFLFRETGKRVQNCT